MNVRLAFVCLAFVLFCGANGVPKTTGTGKIWALLVAGSNTWGNYRHQADVCHAYQVLHAHGIPDENIVVMMYDDIASNRQNPTPGIIINHPNGADVYQGVLKDYTGKDVTPDNFISILTGDKEAMANIGSGKVIDSGPDDQVFVNFVDHGGVGLIAFPNGEVTTKQLNDALQKMHDENRYNQLVFYLEACESGSMFQNSLPDDINIFATTAANAHESSYACYYDRKRRTYLGDVYSVNWMEDSDKEDIETETLDAQYQIVKSITTTSHVMEYGDLTIATADVVGQFQGPDEPSVNMSVPAVSTKDGVPSLDVPLDILYRRLADANAPQERRRLQAEIDEMIEKRAHLNTVVKKLVSRVASSYDQEQRLVSARPEKITNLDCHHTLVKAFSQHCFNFGMHPYALKQAYILANMCENGINANDVVQAMQQVCKNARNSRTIE